MKIRPSSLVFIDIEIEFDQEIGMDGGGLKREWLSLINKEVFNPSFGLFSLSANKAACQPNPWSIAIPDFEMHYRFLGRLIAKSMVDEEMNLEANFTKSFLKHMTNQELIIRDLEDIDLELCQQLELLLQIDVTDLQLDFTYVQNVFGQMKEIELIPNGKNILVTNENKIDYVKSYCSAKMQGEISVQIQAFLAGIYDVIPKRAFSLLNANELGILLSGMPSIDINDLKQHTTYSDYNENDQIIIWLWEVLEEFDEQPRADFLFFYSGSYKIPVGGFSNMPLTIQKIYDSQALPMAHTCFYQLDLPEYESKDKLKEKLLKAISEGIGGYHVI